MPGEGVLKTKKLRAILEWDRRRLNRRGAEGAEAGREEEVGEHLSLRRVYGCMGPGAPEMEMRFTALRKAYDDAFHQLSQRVRLLQSLASQATPDRRASEEAARTVEQARCVYHERRDQLAQFLLSHAVKAVADRRSEVERLAYQLWENAGRPFGRAEEHWYRAEQMIHGAA